MSTLAPIAEPNTSISNRAMPLCAGEAIAAADFAPIRRRMILECCKWDPQVGDVSTLAPFPLLIHREDWNELSELAQRLTTELLDAELELAQHPRFHKLLGIPRSIRRALSDINPAPTAMRVMRFDFHWTRDGWRISEVNSDVPGGFSEASEFTRMMSRQISGTSSPGDVGACWAKAMTRVVAEGDVALLAAPGFMEDQQVIAYLAKRLVEGGFRPHQAAPAQMSWSNGRARISSASHDGAVGAIVRFYQAEWLAHLPRHCPWRYFFGGSTTPIVNPGIAILSESKRFPLTWNHLSTRLPTWRALLPESRDPRDAPWRRDESWLLKTAFCNTGDTVIARDASTPRQWNLAAWSVRLNPRQWVAQRRFEPVPLASPMGGVYPCIGVYTIDGRVAGAYTRISPHQFIDYRAIDAALLIIEDVK